MFRMYIGNKRYESKLEFIERLDEDVLWNHPNDPELLDTICYYRSYFKMIYELDNSKFGFIISTYLSVLRELFMRHS